MIFIDMMETGGFCESNATSRPFQLRVMSGEVLFHRSAAVARADGNIFG